MMRGIMEISRSVIEGKVALEAGAPPLDRAKALSSAFTEANVFMTVLETMSADDPAQAAELKTLMQEAKQHAAWAASEIAKAR
ncbi:hypothetical protein [Paraburkholderia sp. C35]|uniref:hypothetical protein n=1 Tax=Paraburkholderia sp. C35 TaxID=2126993 RepID=UPI0013A5AD53|nr:hypothetical protein [Paraburkholderia sp. C35]